MRGVLFTLMFELVEETFGLEMLDALIHKSKLTDGGSYTAVGTYPHRDMLEIVTNLSEMTDTPANQLMTVFGNYMFPHLLDLHVENTGLLPDSCFGLLSKIENSIHIEVKKLYPDADLPHFSFSQSDQDTAELVYHSNRPFGSVAQGMIEGCVKHYGEQVIVTRFPEADISDNDVTFTAKRTH